jgi:DNA-binding MarR family transcriptional regulator
MTPNWTTERDCGLRNGVARDAPLVHEIERLLTAGIGITARAIDQTAQAAELTLVQWRVLVVAAETERLRIGELAAHLGGSVPSASRLVRRVETRGLLTATRDEEDRRATIVSLTPAGRRLVQAVVGRRRGLIHQALQRGSNRRPPAAVEMLRQIADQVAELA